MERIKLKKLLKNIPVDAVKGSKEIEITGITSNSKRVAPGNLFIAKKGLTVDGARFIPDAIASGAAAVLTDLYDPFYPDITQIVHGDVAAAEALLAKEYYHHPGQRLFLIGITGTNGKTTTSYLIRHLLQTLREECGLIGTIETIIGSHVFPSTQTTPDVLTNYKTFYEMAHHQCTSCVMEVSSHALHQGRVHSIDYDVAVFTNLTQDHLDYHSTMEEYAAAKATLFSSLDASKTAVVNLDSPFCEQMIAQCPARVIRYGLNASADLYATDLQLTPSGMQFQVHTSSETLPFTSSLIGRYNVYNLLAAIGVGLAKSFPLKKILNALKDFPTVAGRLERIANPAGLNLFVDYAHTGDALENVLNTLRELNPARILLVFGCGGNRDVARRTQMGAIAEQLADIVILTNDNPRSEDPEEILRQILLGFQEPSRAQLIPDRAEAIYRAIALATPNDIVLIAGKGHEAYQIFSHQTIPFDDRAVAKAAVAALV